MIRSYTYINFLEGSVEMEGANKVLYIPNTFQDHRKDYRNKNIQY